MSVRNLAKNGIKTMFEMDILTFWYWLYVDALLSKKYLTAEGIILEGLKLIGQF